MTTPSHERLEAVNLNPFVCVSQERRKDENVSETKCRVFARRASGRYEDLGVRMQLDLVRFPLIEVEINDKKVIGFRLTDLLTAVPDSFLTQGNLNST